jgi:DNA-binding beta-propeller fold protein YncE
MCAKPNRSVRMFALAVVPFAALSSAVLADDPYKVAGPWPHLPDGYRFGQVSAVAPDGQGEVFVFHRGEHPIMVFDRSGKFLRSFGEGLITKAHGLRFDSEGNVWITDVGNHTVRRFSPDGKLQTTLGTEGKSGDSPEQFNQPADIAFGPHGELYVADGYGNSRVVKYGRDGKFLKAWGKKGSGDGEFNLVHAVVVDSRGTVYVGDRENNRIQIFDGDGNFKEKWTEFGAPFGLFLDGPHQRFLVADGKAHRCVVLDAFGKILQSWGRQGSEPGQFDLPHSISMDTDGSVYVTEITGQRVQKFMR